jgi:hypothetical protein
MLRCDGTAKSRVSLNARNLAKVSVLMPIRDKGCSRDAIILIGTGRSFASFPEIIGIRMILIAIAEFEFVEKMMEPVTRQQCIFCFVLRHAIGF